MVDVGKFFDKKVLVLIVIILLILIGFVIFGTQQKEINQEFEFYDSIVSKNVLIGSERIETYTINLQNPVFGYLIIPKTIVEDASKLAISGDFDAEIIENYPILKIESNDYSPGTKNLIIKSTIGNAEHTSILFLIPLVEYNSFSETELADLEETITQFSQLDENYFTFEETEKIMKEFEEGTKENSESADFKKKNENTKISLAEVNYISPFNSLVNTLNSTYNVREKSNTKLVKKPEIEKPVTLQNNPTEILNKILQPRIQANNIGGEFSITINFKPEKKSYALPEKILMTYNEKIPKITWNAIVIINEETNISDGTELVFTGPENFDFSYLRLTKQNYSTLGATDEEIIAQINENDESKPIYLVSIGIDTGNYDETEIIEKITIKHDGILIPKIYSSEIRLIKNNCAERTNYYWFGNETNFNYEIQKEYSNATICLKEFTEFSLTEKILSYDINFGNKEEIDSSLLIGAINTDPSSSKKIEEEIQKINEKSLSDFYNAEEHHKKWMGEYNSIAHEAIEELNFLDSKTTDNTTKEIIQKNILWFEYLIIEQKLKNDPTDRNTLEESVEKYLDYFFYPIPTYLMTEEAISEKRKEILEIQETKYGTYSKWLLTEIASKYYLIEELLIEKEKAFALLLLEKSKGSGCPTALSVEQYIFNTASPQYPLQMNKDFRDIVKFLSINEAKYISTGSTSVIGGQRQLTEIEATLKRFQDSTYCTLNLEEFENPPPSFFGSTENAQLFNFKRISLRNLIKNSVKEKVGLRLSAYLLYNYSEILEKATSETLRSLERQETNFNTEYEKIQMPKKGGLTLLELYNIKDINTISALLGTNLQDIKNDLAIESIQSAFNNQLKPIISVVKNQKFLGFVKNIGVAEKLEGHLAIVDNTINSELQITAKKIIEKEDSEKFNYILYNLTTGKLLENYGEEINTKMKLIEGLKQLKTSLLEGKDFVDILNEKTQEFENKELNILAPEETITEIINPQDPRATTLIIKKTNPKYSAWAEKVNSLGEENYSVLALNQPVIKAEIEKQQIIESNQTKKSEEIKLAKTEKEKLKILLPEEDQAKIMLKIADYYYDSGLYWEAYQNYAYIKEQLPNSTTATYASTKMFSMEKGTGMFFGKMYWETYGKIAKEFTTVSMIASYLAIYGTLKFLATPEIASARNIKNIDKAHNTKLTQTLANADDYIITGSGEWITITSQTQQIGNAKAIQNAIKGFEIVNGQLVQLNLKTSRVYSMLENFKALRTQRFFNKIFESNTWKVLTKDRLVNEQWYQNFIEKKVAYDTKEFLRTKYGMDSVLFAENPSDELIKAWVRSYNSDPVQALDKDNFKIFLNRTSQALTEKVTELRNYRALTSTETKDLLATIEMLKQTTVYVDDVVAQSTAIVPANYYMKGALAKMQARQAFSLSEVTRAKALLTDGSSTALVKDFLGSPIDDIISFSRTDVAYSSALMLTQKETKLATINTRISELETYLAKYGKTSSLLSNPWQAELMELKNQSALLTASDYADDVVSIACSAPCGFKIKSVEGSTEINFGDVEAKTEAISWDPNKTLVIEDATVDGAKATIKVEQIIDIALPKAIITTSQTTNGEVLLKIMSPKIMSVQTLEGGILTGIGADLTPNSPWTTIKFNLDGKGGRIFFVNEESTTLGAHQKGQEAINVNIDSHLTDKMTQEIGLKNALKVTTAHETTHFGFYSLAPNERQVAFDAIETTIGSDDKLYALYYKFLAWEHGNPDYFLRSGTIEEIYAKYKKNLSVNGIANNLSPAEETQILDEYINAIKNNSGKSYGIKLDDPNKQMLIDGAKERVGELRISKVSVQTPSGKQEYYINSDTLFDELTSVMAEQKFYPERVVDSATLQKLKGALPQKASGIISEAQSIADEAVNTAYSSGKHPALQASTQEITTPILTQGQCISGCLYPTRSASIINDPTLATEGKLVEPTQSLKVSKGSIFSSEKDLPKLKEDYARLIHFTSNQRGVELALKQGFIYEQQGAISSTATIFTNEEEASAWITSGSKEYSRFENDRFIVIMDIPQSQLRLHNDVAKAPGIIPKENIIGVIDRQAIGAQGPIAVDMARVESVSVTFNQQTNLETSNNFVLPKEEIWGGESGFLEIKEGIPLGTNSDLVVEIDGEKYLKLIPGKKIILERFITIDPNQLESIYISQLLTGRIMSPQKFAQVSGQPISSVFGTEVFSDSENLVNFDEILEDALSETIAGWGVSTTYTDWISKTPPISNDKIKIIFSFEVPTERVFAGQIKKSPTYSGQVQSNIPLNKNNEKLAEFGFSDPGSEDEIMFPIEVPNEYYKGARFFYNGKEWTIEQLLNELGIKPQNVSSSEKITFTCKSPCYFDSTSSPIKPIERLDGSLQLTSENFGEVNSFELIRYGAFEGEEVGAVMTKVNLAGKEMAILEQSLKANHDAILVFENTQAGTSLKIFYNGNRILDQSNSLTTLKPYLDTLGYETWQVTGSEELKNFKIFVPNKIGSHVVANNFDEARKAVFQNNMQEEIALSIEKLGLKLDDAIIKFSDGSTSTAAELLVDNTQLPSFESVTQNSGVQILQGIPGKSGWGYMHTKLHLVDYANEQEFESFIKSTLQSPDFKITKNNEPATLWFKEINAGESKFNMVVSKTENGVEKMVTMYPLRNGAEFMQIIRTEAGRGNVQGYKSNTDSTKKAIKLNNDFFLELSKGSDGLTINAKAIRGVPEEAGFETAGKSNINNYFRGIENYETDLIILGE